MNYEWCVCCGILLGPNSKSNTYCNDCRDFSAESRDADRALLCAREEVFWQAIAHERAECNRQRDAERAERTAAALRLMTGEHPPISGNELLASLKLDPTIPINTTPVLSGVLGTKKNKG